MAIVASGGVGAKTADCDKTDKQDKRHYLKKWGNDTHKSDCVKTRQVHQKHKDGDQKVESCSENSIVKDNRAQMSDRVDCQTQT
jgi:hypothetical protein